MLKSEKPWIKNASNLLIVNSILGAMSGILLVFELQDSQLSSHSVFPTIALGLSLFWFVWSAEQVTVAIDELDVRKYLYTHIFYNFGVILLFYGIAYLIYIKLNVPFWIPFGIITLLLFRPWFKDQWFLFIDREKFCEYVEELEGLRRPETESSWLMKKYYRAERRKYFETLPHDNVYTRLGPSPVHGVGVFAIRPIPQGTNIFQKDVVKMVWVSKSELGDVGPKLKKLYEDFCVVKGNYYGCPVNFNSITPGWYLNNSDDPNVRCTEDFDFIAIKNINIGDELFARYSDYSEESKF